MKWKGYKYINKYLNNNFIFKSFIRYSECTWEPYENLSNLYSLFFKEADIKFYEKMKKIYAIKNNCHKDISQYFSEYKKLLREYND